MINLDSFVRLVFAALIIIFGLLCCIIDVAFGGDAIFQVTHKEPEPAPSKTDTLRLLLPNKSVSDPVPKPVSDNSTKPRVGNYPPAYSSIGGRTVDTTIDHLVRDHHENAEYVKSLTPEERNRLHGKHHMPHVQIAPSYPQGNCANGQCGRPQQFFRRQR